MKYYKLNINSLSDEEYKEIYNKADEIRKKKCDNYKLIDDKKRCLAAYYLLLKVLEEYSIDKSKISYDKEHIILIDSDYNISISHSGYFVLLAISKNKIGIDIERIRDINFAITGYFCNDNDLDYIDNDINKFFEVWTFKEAFSKANGMGISRESKNINFKDYNKEFVYFDNYIVCLYEKTQD